MTESLWQDLLNTGQVGGFRRVDSSHPLELYLTLSLDGEPGMVLFTSEQLPAAPRLESLEITETKRADGRWALGIWLRDPSLLKLFDQLCRDLVEASREVASPSAPGFLVSRLRRWQSLLEGGQSGPSLVKLRGLMGELVVLKACLKLWDPADVVDAWVGPLGEPQDFAFPERVIEVKSVYPTAKTARITSIAQLDVSREQLLAVVTLATVIPEGHGIEPLALASEIQKELQTVGAPQGAVTFMSRVDLVLSVDEPYSGPRFRVDGVKYFDVIEGFPRLRRLEVPEGIDDARYDILLANCAPFEASLRR